MNQNIEFLMFNNFHKNFPRWLGFHLGELSLRKTLNMFSGHTNKKENIKKKWFESVLANYWKTHSYEYGY